MSIQKSRVRLRTLTAVAGFVLVAIAVPRPVGGAPPSSEMHLTFESHFDSLVGLSADGKIWSTFGGDGWRTLENNKEAQFYSDASVGVNPFSVEDGILTITAAPGKNPVGLPFNSGILTTRRSFRQLYGYFELRARLPAGAGLWPAFWLLPDNGRWPPEIDVLEQLGNMPATIYVGTHSAAGGPNVATTTAVSVADTSDGFHVYGLEWEDSHIAWYFDGRLVYRIPTPADLHVPMYLVLNLAVGGSGSWPGPPTEQTVFPAKFRIDYVRAYAR